MDFINFAIDLGTTNSLIAKHENGTVQLFKNPKGFKETLPSVVAFRKNGILVGDKAKELKDRDPQNVFSSFKRKMGTDETYYVEQTQEIVDPIKLSTYVLNELKTFVRDEQPRSVVITIPASFDTIQSNATKDAGNKAGFEEVVLLQEPIAACLAVFNQQHTESKTGKWLIYDLGGGTFDVAIVAVSEEELKIIDHEGNNFLGGLDFDIAIVKDLILPQLKTQGNFTKLISDLVENTDLAHVQPVFNYLLFYAEQLKIELTSYPEGFVEFQLKDDNGEQQDIEIAVKRDAFNQCIDGSLQHTIHLVNELMTTNGLKPADLEEIVLVGGSTYIPYVKEKLEKELGLHVNQKVDPTNAIAQGAAYYAGNKPTKLAPAETTNEPDKAHNVKVKPIYERQSRETDELIILKSEGEIEGVYYRVYRTDQGFDSGKKLLTLSERISVPLQLKTTNEFVVELYNASGSLLDAKAATIQISQGLFIIDGQPLPHDICIEVDDLESNETVLETIFEKNAILPLTKTIYKMLSRDMLESSSDELVINILEGDRNASPSTNQVIGCIAIRPKEIGKNLIKDSDIGITLSISESRDLTVSATISMIDFEVKNVFNPSQKTVLTNKLREELNFLAFSVNRELQLAISEEAFETAAEFQQMITDIENAQSSVGTHGEIAGDVKYHNEELKRQIAIRYDKLVKKKKLMNTLNEYREAKNEYEFFMQEPDFPERLKSAFQDICRKEAAAIGSGNVSFLRSLQRRMRELLWEYERNSIGYMRNVYMNYKMLPAEAFTNRQEASRLFDIGDQMMAQETTRAAELHNCISRLWHILDNSYKSHNENDGFDLKGTGLR